MKKIIDAITLPAKRIVTLTGTRGGPPHAQEVSNSTLTFSRFIGNETGRVYVSTKGTGTFDPDDVHTALDLVKRDK